MIRLMVAMILVSLLFSWEYFWPLDVVLADSKPQPETSLPSSQPVVTKTLFKEEMKKNIEVIRKQVVYEDNPEVEAGTDTVLAEGSDGQKITSTKITYYLDEIYAQEIIGIEVIEPKNKIISRGSKIVWKTLNTPDGEIKYWKKMRVYATHYDSHCLGCDEWTAIGMRQGKGVVAVDPRVIRMRSQLYVPGYGLAVAGDTGGAIKGNIIDLGFEDARTAGWSARYIDIYLL